MDLTVVVPCFNEQRALPHLHDALCRVLPRLATEYEIVVVDDGSTDRTLPQVRALAAVDSRLGFVSLSRNFGKEAALLAGLQRARGRRVAIMDADLQHPPELLGRMLALLDDGRDQVVACRDRRHEPLSRALPAKVFYRVFNGFRGLRIPAGAGDYRVLSQRAVQALLALPEQHRFSKGLFAWIGFDTAHVPLPHVPRRGGRSKWSRRGLLEYALDGFFSFHHKPLRFAVHLGAALVLGSLSGLVAGVPALFAGVLAVCGVQLGCLGLIGEYLGRIHLETKHRPHFLVKETGGRAADRGSAVLCGASADPVQGEWWSA